MTAQEKQAIVADLLERERGRLISSFRARMSDLDAMDVEDVIQDVWLSFFQRSDLLASVENLAGYLYRTVRNRLLDRLRHRRRAVSLEAPRSAENDATWRDVLPAPDTLASELAERELRRDLAEALDGLDPKHRAVWVATELDGHTFRELSEAWGEPINTLLSRKRRAALALQAALKKHAPNT